MDMPRALWPTSLLVAALLLALADARSSIQSRALHSVSSCAVTFPTGGSVVAAGSDLAVSATSGGTLARVDVFLARSSTSAGCKMQEITASSGQTAYSTTIPIPIQATGTLYVYVKCKSTISTDPLVVSAYISITITGGQSGNIAPMVKFTSPSPTQTFTAPVTITAAVAACDLDGTIAKVDFLIGTGQNAKFATSTAVPYAGSLYIPTAQTVTLYAMAFDNANTSTTSAPLTITVGGTTGTDGGSGGSGSSSGWTLDVVNGFGGGSKPLYTWVNLTANAPPAGQVFAGWVTSCSGSCPQVQWQDPSGQLNYASSLYARSGGTISVTATYTVDAGIPVPVFTHPRLLITASDLPMLQSWATNSNPMYANGYRPALVSALNKANSAWSWSFNGGTGALFPGTTLWSDLGTSSWERDHTEAYAMFFAFAALIHNDRSYALRAKDLLMWMIRQADVNGPTGNDSLPFGSQFFATFNRASHYGDGFGATYDWLQWSGFQPPLFTTADKSQIRRVFLMWANANIAGYMHPAPIGMVNNPLLLSGARGIANNYASAHMRQLAYYALSFDAADDPVVDAKLPEAFIGNTLRSFIYNVAGAWLYSKYAIMEQPATVAAAYGIPASTPNLGSMSGGLSPEGFLYGSSMTFVMQALAALHTSGWGTVAASGPQMQLINSTWWDKYLTGYLSQLVPAPFNATGSLSYMGQVWQMFNYGDCLRLYIDPPQFDTFGMLGWYGRQVGNNQRRQISQWIGANAMLGGAAQLYYRVTSIWGNSYAFGGILHFLLYDPSYTGAPDPRPSLPTTLIDPSLGRVVARTSWSTTASAFAYKCSWENINHQLADCGMFELYRKGEYLTKENTGYASDSSDNIGTSSVLKNTLTIQNTVSDPSLSVPVAMQGDELVLFTLGSQQAEGFTNGGDPNSTINDTPQYTAIHSSFAGLYNRPNVWNTGSAAIDVQHASRTLLWLKGQEALVVYDRATTLHSGKFKRFNMNFIVPPQQSGNVITQTTTVNRLQVTSLLPVGATITVQPIPAWHNPAEMEPSTYHMTVEDPTGPADVRFLHVLQAADRNAAAPTPAVLLTGSVNGGAPGTAQGALVGTAFAAIFKSDATLSAAPVTSMSFSLPANAGAPAKVFVTGLVPGTMYSISGPDGAGVYMVNQGGAGTVADAAGVAAF